MTGTTDPSAPFVVVRHGETEWSSARRHTGRTDLPLTALGARQADALAPVLAPYAFARVLCSPLVRAVDTCRRAGLGARAELCPDAVEWDYGVYEGRRTDEIRIDEPGWSVWTHPIPGGETLAAVAARADRVVAAVRATDGAVVLFAHAHFLRVLAARWVGAEAAFGRHFVLDAASVSVLGHERDAPVIERWNGRSPDVPG